MSRGRVIFSAIQPTGTPHLGNYLGAIRQWVRLQDESAQQQAERILYSVVDLHAITMPQPRDLLRRRRRETLAALIAAGIRPERCSVFFQSSVPAHAELMWILSCTASVGYLSRMTQWKTKLAVSSSASILDDGVKSALKLGLFSYPVLQAADILVHRATHVPVGDDQRQHLEFARECVTNFNHAYGCSVLVPPETLTASATRIMSLRNPTQKMSKSDPNPSSRILITDSPDEVRKKIGSAVTDSQNTVSTPPELVESFRGASLRDLKEAVSSTVITHLDGVGQRFRHLLHADGGKYLDAVEEDGARQARSSAAETIKAVRSAIGF